MYIQKLPSVGVNLIVKGVAYNFDLTGIYKGIVNCRYLNLEPVRVISYITQGNTAEKALTDDNGNVKERVSLSVSSALNEITTFKSQKDCLGVLIKTLNIEGVTGTQYITLFRKTVGV